MTTLPIICSLIGLLITDGRSNELRVYSDESLYTRTVQARDYLPARIDSCKEEMGLVRLSTGIWVDPIELRLPSRKLKHASVSTDEKCSQEKSSG